MATELETPAPAMTWLHFAPDGTLTAGGPRLSISLFDKNPQGRFVSAGMDELIFEDRFLQEVRVDSEPFSPFVGEFGVAQVYIPSNPRPSVKRPGLWTVDIVALYFSGGRFVKSVQSGTTDTRVGVSPTGGPVVEIEQEAFVRGDP